MHQDDRIEGALLGTMIGDALGCPFEGTPRGDMVRLRQAVERRIQSPRAWGHTDDTEMMLSVAESIIARGMVDEGHLLQTMAERHDPARGYGKGARGAFRAWRETGSWQLASRALWTEGSRGNGAAVRVTPISILHRNDSVDVVRDSARRSAMPTHSHEEAVVGTELVATAVWLALNGSSPTEVITGLRAESAEALSERIALIDIEQPIEAAVLALGHGVLAIESVPIAIWAHCRNQSFEDAIVDAVCAGGDTDTIGAMTGAIAGATYGASAIPESWVEALERPSRRRVQELAAHLRTLSPI